MERNPNFPNFWMALLVLFGLFAVQVVLSLLFAGFGRRVSGGHPELVALVAALSFGVVIAWLLNYKGLSYKRLLHESRFSGAATMVVLALPLLLLMTGVSVLLIDLESVVIQWFPPSAQQLEVFKDIMNAGALTFAVLCIVSPVLEEMLFRGIFLRSFLRQYAPQRAIVMSALLFALAHLNVYQALTAFVIGLLLAWLYVKTQSLLPSILAHAFYNLNALAWTLSTEQSDRFPNAPSIELPGFAMQLVGIGLTLAGLSLLRKLLPDRLSPPTA